MDNQNLTDCKFCYFLHLRQFIILICNMFVEYAWPLKSRNIDPPSKQ